MIGLSTYFNICNSACWHQESAAEYYKRYERFRDTGREATAMHYLRLANERYAIARLRVDRLLAGDFIDEPSIIFPRSQWR